MSSHSPIAPRLTRSEYLAGIRDRPVRATLSGDELRERLGGPLPVRGDGSDPRARSRSPRPGGRHGGVAGPALLRLRHRRQHARSATAADWLVSAWDQNAQMFVMSPIAAVVEQIVAGVAEGAVRTAGDVERRVRHRRADGELHVAARRAAPAVCSRLAGTSSATDCSARRRSRSSSATSRIARSSRRCGCSASAPSGSRVSRPMRKAGCARIA